MDRCAQCMYSNDTVELGDYFRCDHDESIHWKDDGCDRFERRTATFADFDANVDG